MRADCVGDDDDDEDEEDEEEETRLYMEGAAIRGRLVGRGRSRGGVEVEVEGKQSNKYKYVLYRTETAQALKGWRREKTEDRR